MRRFADLALSLPLVAACAAADPGEAPQERAMRLESEGEWIEALAAWGDYDPADGCLNCRLSKERFQREGFIRCLTALGCHDEALLLLIEAWLSPRLTELGETFPRDLVRAARRAGRLGEVGIRAREAPFWREQVWGFLEIARLREDGNVRRLLSRYLELAPEWWWDRGWEGFRRGPHAVVAEAADALGELAPVAWEAVRDVAREGGHRGTWALVALARMRHPEADRLIRDLSWIRGPVDPAWVDRLRSIADVPQAGTAPKMGRARSDRPAGGVW
jgi:hypothetical protein